MLELVHRSGGAQLGAVADVHIQIPSLLEHFDRENYSARKIESVQA